MWAVVADGNRRLRTVFPTSCLQFMFDFKPHQEPHWEDSSMGQLFRYFDSNPGDWCASSVPLKWRV